MTRYSIYHVEDNEADRKLLALALELEQLPVDVQAAQDGEEALEFLEQCGVGKQVPDLIVLDLNLPKLSGIEVLAGIRKHLHLQRAQVVVLTSSDFVIDQDKLDDLGVRDYVRKPMDLSEFMALAKRLFEIAAESASVPVAAQVQDRQQCAVDRSTALHSD